MKNKRMTIYDFLVSHPHARESSIMFPAGCGNGMSLEYTSNGADCSNAYYDSCHQSTNRGHCTNASQACGASKNKGHCR